MAKDEINISGEKFLALKDPLEKMAEFATRLRISLRTATELTRPGIHGLRMDTLDKIAAGLGTDRIGVYKMVGIQGTAEANGTPVIRLDEFQTKKDLMAAVAKAWNDHQVKQAAKKPGKS